MKKNTAGESLNNLENRRSQRNTLNDFMPQVSHQRTNYREEEGIRGSYRRPDLPEGWVAMQSRGTGKEYYVNEIIGGKGQYEFPTEPARGLNGFGVNTEQGGVSRTPYGVVNRGGYRRNGSNGRSSGNEEEQREWREW